MTTQANLAVSLRLVPSEALSSFARERRPDLLRSFMTRGRWSPAQEAMVRRWIEDAQRSSAPEAQSAPIAGAGLERLHALFARARSAGLRFPRITINIGSESTQRQIDLRPTRDGSALRVRQGSDYFGTLDARGIFHPGRDAVGTAGLVDEIEAGLRRMAENPAAEATAYGRLTGACCFCRRPLTDGRSVAMGYGPICAENYGLPWGDERVQVQNVAISDSGVARTHQEPGRRWPGTMSLAEIEADRAERRARRLAAEAAAAAAALPAQADEQRPAQDRSWRNELAR